MDAYLTIATIATDVTMVRRIAACAAQQGQDVDPEGWAWTTAYTWAASPGWAQRWDTAVAGGNCPDPASDMTVISDADILATVQPMLAP